MTSTPLPSVYAPDVVSQTDIPSIVMAELKRPIDARAFVAATQFLAAGGTVAAYRRALATSAEAQSDIIRGYAAVLGRVPDAAGALAFTNAFGESLTTLRAIRVTIASSAEAQARYHASLRDRAWPATGRCRNRGATDYPRNGGTLAGLHAAFATSPELRGSVQDAYVNAGYTDQTDLGIPEAAGASEVASGVSVLRFQGGTGPIDRRGAICRIWPRGEDHTRDG